ncbi:hypothetical protein, partial [uncultured Lamprocystis sp.]
MITTTLHLANEKLRNRNYVEAIALYEAVKASKPALAKFIDFNLSFCKRKLVDVQSQKKIHQGQQPKVSVIIPV